MPVRSRSFLRIVSFSLPAVLLIFMHSANGQNLQMLQGLTPEQRAAISQQLAGAGTSGLGSAENSLGGRQQEGEEELRNLVKQQQRELMMDERKQRAEIERLSPFLEGADWIVITIDSSPLPAVTEAGSQTSPLGGLVNLERSALNALPLPGVNPGSTAGKSAAPVISPDVTAGGYAGPLPAPQDQQVRQRELIDLIRSKNPYQLSRDGVLALPGFAPIPLAGLTEQLATLRLGAEPTLRDLYIRVTKLPLNKIGPAVLKPFGYDLFDRQISTFAPATNVPVPADYVVGPGDLLDVQLYGSRNGQLQLVVGRDGRVSFPELGPITVGGQTFNSVKAGLESRVKRQMIGVRASITMGDTRTIRVFVLGDAKQPGSYAVSGLATISSALYAAGGVQQIGSLRNIQLKRRGELVSRMDLYDMLIRGDTTEDARLLPGDVIFVPPIGPTVTVDGEIHRPAIYEISNESSVADVIQLAGGLTPEADTAKLALTRIDAALHRVVLQVNLSGAAGKSEAVRNGDSLEVPRLRPTLDAGVLVQGYVYTAGAFAYHPDMRLTDVIRSVDDLKPNADLHYVLIRRELPPDRRVTVLSTDLVAALDAPGSPADPPLMPRDRITVFDLQSSRISFIRPILEDLKLQSNISYPQQVVRIDGRANVPGDYPLEPGMTVRDLVRAGGGLSDGAYGGGAELTRYKVINGEVRRTELVQIDLAAALRGDPAANLPLEPFDSLSVKEIQAWTEHGVITVHGEVRFPGEYSIKQGETLKSVLLRAGGLTQYAFAEGSAFTRAELREREQRELDLLTLRMQKDIAFTALQGAALSQSGAAGATAAAGAAGQAGAAAALSIGHSLLAQLSESRAVGRLIINLPRILRSPIGSPSDVVLRDGDDLIVPKFQQEVTVIGEVQTVTSHLYRPGLSRDDYIAMSGGETARADRSRIYVVRADGEVVANEGARWFSMHSTSDIKPGDTVVVPLNAEHIPALPLWQAVTQILYNIAIATAAVHTL
jgi:polysaccharide export outer membrane protein